MKCEIVDVRLTPEQRRDYINRLLFLDGLPEIKEIPDACYCAVPLTDVPEEFREQLANEHDAIKECIKAAGIKIYDPKDAGLNPWIKITDEPEKVYDADSIQVVTPKFFEFTNIAASTGAGIEEQKAITYNNIGVIFTKRGTYVSRMPTGARRMIVLEYEEPEKQAKQITGVFQRLRNYEPGIGTCSVHGNALFGFSNGKPICLKGLIGEMFPELRYDFSQYVTSV